MTGVARYFVGNDYEVVCEMEHLPKHRDHLLWVVAESPSSRLAFGDALPNTTVVSVRFASDAVGRLLFKKGSRLTRPDRVRRRMESLRAHNCRSVSPRKRDMGHSVRMSEQLDAWGDFRVGDRVYFVGAFGRPSVVPGGLQYELLELWSTTASISGEPDALAVIRDAHGETNIVNIRTLRRM